jgi:hypothetical protein
MIGLDFRKGPPFNSTDDDSGDVAFVSATKFIGGQDAMEEFLACGVYPLATGVDGWFDLGLEVENYLAQVCGR